MNNKIQLIHGDCLEKMKDIPDGSIDLVLVDPPYEITNATWDIIIPFEPMWEQLTRIVKHNSAIIFTASQPFTSMLVLSNLKLYRHSWVYKKRCPSNFAQAKHAPLKEHEDVLVFSKGRVNYYPIKEERQGGGKNRVKYKFTDLSTESELYGIPVKHSCQPSELRYPSSVQEFNNRAKGDRGYKSTQKPIKMLEYYIKTYSQEGDTVLDFAMGSGSTGIACLNTNRNFIGIELMESDFNIAKTRIHNHEQ